MSIDHASWFFFFFSERSVVQSIVLIGKRDDLLKPRTRISIDQVLIFDF